MTRWQVPAPSIKPLKPLSSQGTLSFPAVLPTRFYRHWPVKCIKIINFTHHGWQLARNYSHEPPMSGERIRLCFDHRDRSQARTVGKADFATGSFKGASLSIHSNKTIQAGINLLLLVTVCVWSKPQGGPAAFASQTMLGKVSKFQYKFMVGCCCWYCCCVLSSGVDQWFITEREMHHIRE